MCTAQIGRTHGCSDPFCDVKIFLANPEPSTHGPKPAVRATQSPSALPPKSDVDLFRYREGVIHLDAEISDGTLDLGVPQ